MLTKNTKHLMWLDLFITKVTCTSGLIKEISTNSVSIRKLNVNPKIDS